MPPLRLALTLLFASPAGALWLATQLPFTTRAQETTAPRPPRVVSPDLCPDGPAIQYSGYLPGSPIFFWFFPSRSDPSTDPIGLWSNGGPGSSGLTGMQYAGPCEVVDDGSGGWEMRRREWSFNDGASVLMIDNERAGAQLELGRAAECPPEDRKRLLTLISQPIGAGFSYAPFPAVDNIYSSAKDTYAFLQSFVSAFPEYASNPWSVNSLSYGGHYAPAYASYIQHMNLRIAHSRSPWTDVWPRTGSEDRAVAQGHLKPLNLTSISVGNGWINGRVQYRAMLEFACGGAGERGVPRLADGEDCRWAQGLLSAGEALLDRCEGRIECAAAGLYTEGIASIPYTRTNLNPYDYRRPSPYNETDVIGFYNNVTVQARLGVIAGSEQGKVWMAHSDRVWAAYVYSGDWEGRTDYLFERLLRSGVSVLKYQGMVDWICNYLGIRRIMGNLPDYKYQEAFNNLTMLEWRPTGRSYDPNMSDEDFRDGAGEQYGASEENDGEGVVPGHYKCLLPESGSSEGTLCYLEIEGAGHVLSLDKPREGSLMIAKWMREGRL